MGFIGFLVTLLHLCKRMSSGVGGGVHTLYFFYETTAWNNFILYMHISLGGLFNICENWGGGVLYAPPEKIMEDFMLFH